MTDRKEIIANAVRFLSDPKVQEAPLEKRISFLESKGLTRAEIDLALSQVTTTAPTLPPKPPQTSQVILQQKTTWKEITLGLVGVASAGYGMFYLVQHYLFPHFNFQSATKIQNDTDTISNTLQTSEKTLNAINDQTSDIIKGMESHAKQVSESLGEMREFLVKMKAQNDDKMQEIDLIKKEINDLKTSFPQVHSINGSWLKRLKRTKHL
jgi:peroxin-14